MVAQRIVWCLLYVVLAGVIGYGAFSQRTKNTTPRATEHRLPVYGSVPTFSLTERSGTTFTEKGLNGSIWIADFIFTNCTGVCPVLSRTMSRLQNQLQDHNVRFLSLTVDPTRDTPEVLRRYARRYHAHKTDWLFLTGDEAKMRQLIVKGFQLGVTVLPKDDPRLVTHEPIIHSNRYLLIDAKNRIRGYYSGDDPQAVGKLLEHVHLLINRTDTQPPRAASDFYSRKIEFHDGEVKSPIQLTYKLD